MNLEALKVPLLLDQAEYAKGLSDAQSKGESFASKLAGIGGKIAGGLVAGAALGVGAVTAAVVGGIGAVNDWAGTLDSIGDVLGTTANESAGLAVAIQTVGGDVGSLTGQMAFLTKGLDDGKGGMGKTGKVLDSLGVSFKDANGKMLPATDILTSVADVLAGMPDGLEKTALMTQLFGKSGKDLSDTMNALANGGLDAATKKAGEFGLLIGDDGVNSSIEFGKQMETLKFMGQGLAVSLGSQLLPILMPLIQQFMTFAQAAMPQVIAVVTVVAQWLGTNLPIAIQALSTFWTTILYPALQTVWAFIQNNVIPVLQTIWAWLQVNLPPAIQKLGDFWKNTLLPAIQTVWRFIQTQVFPLLQTLYSWLATNLPPAIQTLANFWNNTLYPAIQKIWSFVQTYLMPIFLLLATLVGVTVVLAVTALKVVWDAVLYPAIQKIWSFIQDKLLPIFKEIADFISRTLTPVINNIVNGALAALREAFDAIRRAIQWVIDKVEALIKKLKELVLPEILTGNSPSPLEQSFLDVETVINRLTKVSFKNLTAGLGNIQRAGGQSVINNYTMNINSNARTEDVVTDFNLMRALAG